MYTLIVIRICTTVVLIDQSFWPGHISSFCCFREGPDAKTITMSARVKAFFTLTLFLFQPVIDSTSPPPSSGSSSKAPPKMDKMQGKISMYEQNLLASLLTNYSTSTRPATSTHKAVVVEFDMILNKIVKLDIREQVLVINVKTLLRWYDPQLAWNMSEWNRTNYLNIPRSNIWVPDIMLYNTARDESKAPDDMYKSKVQVDHRGLASWAASVTLKASCSIDIKWFPFDSQSCTLTFGSQSYTRSRLDLKFRKQPKNPGAVKGPYHYNNGDWDLKSLESNRNEGRYDWSPEPYSLIEYKFDLTRLYKYYLLYLVLPCLGLIFLAPFMFYLPGDSGERTGFGITVVLSLSVYLLVISDKLPEKSDKTPLMGALYIVMFFLLVIAMIFGIVTTHLCFKTTKPPRWLWRILFGKKREIKSVDTQKENQMKDDVLVLKTIENGAYQRPSVAKRISALSTRITPSLDEAEINMHKWKIVAARLDKIMFVAYFALIVFVPIIVCIAFI